MSYDLLAKNAKTRQGHVGFFAYLGVLGEKSSWREKRILRIPEGPTWTSAADLGVRPSVPSMGCVLQVETYLTEVMTPTVAKRKA